MDARALHQALTGQLRQIARTCLRLRLEPGEHSTNAPQSGFGGQPWWPVGDPWPLCDNCEGPLGFICQLRLDGGGHWRPDRSELLSIFFCWRCGQNADLESSERPSGDRCRLRLLRLDAQPLAPPATMPADEQLISCRVHGTPVLDAPGWQDVADEFAEIAPHALDELRTRYHLAEAEVLHTHEAPRSQLGGYPHWLHESAWPECRWCGGQMYLLAQLVQEPAARLDWGQERRAYLFCCAEPCDPEALTLVLQS